MCKELSEDIFPRPAGFMRDFKLIKKCWKEESGAGEARAYCPSFQLRKWEITYQKDLVLSGLEEN